MAKQKDPATGIVARPEPANAGTEAAHDRQRRRERERYPRRNECRGEGHHPRLLEEIRRSAAKVTRRFRRPIREVFKRKAPKPTHLKMLTGQVMTNVFIHTTTSDALPPKLVKESGRRGRIAKAMVSIDDLPRLANDKRVRFVELGEPLKTPQPLVSTATVGAPTTPRVKTTSAARHKGGKDVIIGIIDVQGFDFAHPDFLDAKGNTRFLSIWDQGGDARNPPDNAQFNDGAEFTQAHLNAAIKGAKAARVPATEIERQSQREPESHGTHVASIAAGNRGVCPNANIAAVLIDIPPEDMDRRKSFYDSTRLADAVDYLVAFARKRRKPISINVSLGTNGHAHDMSSADQSMDRRGRQRAGRQHCRCRRKFRPGTRGHAGPERLRLAHGPDPRQRQDSEGGSQRRARVGRRGQRTCSTSPRTNSNSGTAPRIASPSSCVHRAWTGSRKSSRASSSRTVSCRTAASSASTTSSITRPMAPTPSLST